ncbi:MAG TPA: hypothetical protein VFB56_10515 [Nitrospiraceae bacterium]|nr:hypothetical protein [Nitrospiraceae bacterium]
MTRGMRAMGLIALMSPLILLSRPDASLADWSAIADANVLYTDNVFELSAARRLSLSEDPSQPSIVPTNRPSDVVWQPSIDLRHRSASRFGLTELSVKAQGFIFTNNPIFNHGDYRLQVYQQVAPDTFVLLRYRYVPNLFLGPNVDRQTGLRFPEEERVTSHTWRMQLERNINERWMITLVGRYGLRLYNEVFSERDTTFYTIGPRIQYAATRWALLTLDYLYERGVADGREEPQFKDDVSYRQHFVSFGTLFQLTKPLSLELVYVYRYKQFTTDIAGDPLLGNVDQVHQGTAELHYDVSPAATVTLGFQRTQRSSSASFRDFFNTNTSLGVRYFF